MNDVVVNHLDGFSGLTQKINDSIKNVRREFIYIGFLLDEADRCGYYLEGGYSSIYEYCELNFGFKKSSTNNFIRVYRNFGEAMFLKDCYKDYSYSQLTEMCSMDVNTLNKCQPTMTVQELRNLKKDKPAVSNSDSFQTSGKHNSDEKTVLYFNDIKYVVPKERLMSLIHDIYDLVGSKFIDFPHYNLFLYYRDEDSDFDIY